MMNKFLIKLIQKYPQLGKWIKVSYGLLKEKPSDKDYILGDGSIGAKTVIRPDGQWKKFLPAEERQRGRYMDSMACVSFSLLNCIETLAKAQFGAVWNKSDRYLATVSCTSHNGNTMRRVLDATRKHFGTLKEKHWTWDQDTFTWNKYYETIPRNIQDIGKAWLKEYELKYQSIYNSKSVMKEMLKYSPLYVGGYSWAKRGNLYYSAGQANHCFEIFGYVDGSHWLAFDTYSPFIKRLEWNFNFKYVKVIYLKKKSIEYNTQKIKELQDRGIKYIMRVLNNGEVFELRNDKLVKITPQEIKNMAIIHLAENKKLIGISEELYSQLLK